jgi:hypothetical protein
MILLRMVYGDDMTAVPVTVMFAPVVIVPSVFNTAFVVADDAFWRFVALSVDMFYSSALKPK